MQMDRYRFAAILVVFLLFAAPASGSSLTIPQPIVSLS
jgi:hypothetical protein